MHRGRHVRIRAPGPFALAGVSAARARPLLLVARVTLWHRAALLRVGRGTIAEAGSADTATGSASMPRSAKTPSRRPAPLRDPRESRVESLGRIRAGCAAHRACGRPSHGERRGDRSESSMRAGGGMRRSPATRTRKRRTACSGRAYTSVAYAPDVLPTRAEITYVGPRLADRVALRRRERRPRAQAYERRVEVLRED